MSTNLLTCPTCEDQLPETEFDPCDPALLDDGIVGLLIARSDADFDNIDDPAEHSSRTSDTSSADNAIRRLVGTGSFTVEFGSSFKVIKKTYFNKNKATVNLKVYHNNAANYELIQLLGCNTTFSVWPIDSNGYIYGGNSGYKMVLQGRENITENLEQKKPLEINGIVEFTNAKDRDVYPLFDEMEALIGS